MMKILFVLLTVLLISANAQAQTGNTPSLVDNVSGRLKDLGWTDKIILGGVSPDGGYVSAHFATVKDQISILAELQDTKRFAETSGFFLKLPHSDAITSYRELSEPSMHIVFYKNDIQIHFDMHCPGYSRPVGTYRHFREVVVNVLYRSNTSQKRVAQGLENNLNKDERSSKRLSAVRD